MPNNANAVDNLTPFPEGTSGNPAGRPKGPITSFLRQFGDADELEFTIVKIKDGTSTTSTARLSTGGKQTINQAIAARLLQMALNGDMKAIREILNRTEGRPHQSITIDGAASDNGAELKAWTADEIDKYEEWQRLQAPNVDGN